MNDYAAASSFSNYRDWTTTTAGYCLHSDWATGYLLHYLVPESSTGGDFGYLRLKAYRTSPKMKSDFNFRYQYDRWPLNIICRYEGENCTIVSEACHYMSPWRMHAIFQQQQQPNGTNATTMVDGTRGPNVVEIRQTNKRQTKTPKIVT